MATIISKPDQSCVPRSLEGSCTLLLGQLQQDVISLLNLGDCGIMALRPCSILPRFHGGTVKTSMRLIYRSTPMLHRTNMPLQLSAQDPDVSSLTDYFDLVTCATAFLAASWRNPEAEMSEKGYPKQVYSDPPKIDLVWLPCGAPPQAALTSESASLDLPLNDGATPQRRKASSLHGLSNAAEDSLLKAQQQFWCQQLKLHDQIEDLKPLYAKLWLKAIDEEETQVAQQVRLETGAAVKTDEGAERKDSGEDETEEDGSDDTEEGDESEQSDGDLWDAHQGTKWQSASPVDGPLDAAAFEQQRARRDSDASSVLSARDQVFKKLQKILTAKARRKSRRTCNIFLVSPVEGENASLVLPGFSPSEVFGPADVERMKQVRDSPPKQCPGPDGLRMLKELVAEIKKVEAASESASIYIGGASMQAEQA
ncbi:unnamed protein product [Symbiodinium necroappetens]|uniref:Uncharacterized protein n=1 Tax=Symbiodinium necroappetens TaxID=1628268 RepID=A0A812TH03_9DINO|nr:unnamed protein product [Symbiodinium necroappetens]